MANPLFELQLEASLLKADIEMSVSRTPMIKSMLRRLERIVELARLLDEKPRLRIVK